MPEMPQGDLCCGGREKEYKEIKEKITELEIKLYAVRKELKNCYENCFGAVGDHADTGA